MAKPTTAEVKAHALITFSTDDALISGFIDAATSYAEARQHREEDYYTENTMPPLTKAAVIMYATFLYESRTGGSGDFFSQSPTSAQQSISTINLMIDMEKDWQV